MDRLRHFRADGSVQGVCRDASAARVDDFRAEGGLPLRIFQQVWIVPQTESVVGAWDVDRSCLAPSSRTA
jgi:hypothetical protein